MKDIINYYYNFDIAHTNNYREYSTFIYNGENFYFVFFNRSEEELNDIVNIIGELKYKGIRVHDIIINKDNKILTQVGDTIYILLKLNAKEDEVITFYDIINYSSRLKLNNSNSKLYRNNWGELWSKKIDYFEYQIKEIGKQKEIILNSFSYYIGLAENAICYVNKANELIKMSEYDNIVLSHRRIFYPNIALNYLNPLSFVFDLEVRDIAEYIKVNFFNDEDAFLDLKTYLNVKKLSPYSYHMLYARLLYPSYYFDIYEKIMNKEDDETKIIKIINKVNDYELFLKNAFIEINKYTKLESINWIMKKE